MTTSEIVAYLGAAAWVPQIVQWVYAAMKTPKLKVVSAPNVEIGFSGYGPIVNLTTAISCERRDALIKLVTLQTIHEKGEHRQLAWTWLKETQAQISVPTGERLEFGKDQPALALKVSILSLTEKRITFLDSEFNAEHARSIARLLEHYEYLQQQGPDPEALLVKSKEFMDGQAAFTKSMYWKEGRYVFEVALHVIGQTAPQKDLFEVVFSKADIASLRRNCELFESYIRALLASKTQKGARIEWPSWNWANPAIRPMP